ncbi:GntR family transcriptional regulator [Ruania alba]|uniref:DNA-binding transcriptional regulator, GntR family n=1 Tax=Ruania alba TaxID=648782 RepID=A0A1H5N0I0_9MICO|nr:GntR family transcriptional regulator [Ruania alba]SEE95139.1 DNA-binding transcriptional regulator, GntR family [Ruania alba]
MKMSDHSDALKTLIMQAPVSRGDRVRDALRQAILDGVLPQGAPLVERDLAEMLGVSKTPVREALKQLQSSGLVVANSYQRVSVRQLDEVTVRAVDDARLAVEPQAVHLGVERHGATPHTGARQALAEADGWLESDQPAQLGLANRHFHRELYVLCGNEWLINFLDKMEVLASFIATAGWRVEPRYTSEAVEHRTILDAVESGDGERARVLLREHISGASRALLRSLEQDAASAAENG